MLEHLKKYTSYGWYVFPLKANAKTPATKNGFYDAVNTFEEAVALFSKYPGCNIGLRTGKESGVTVIDVDVKPDKNGFESLGRKLEAVIVIITPSGGMHYYYAYNPDIKTCTNYNGLAGVDIRNDGGYVVLPPSSIDGTEYKQEGERK